MIKKMYFNLMYVLKKNYYLNLIKKNNYVVILNLHKVSISQNPYYPALSPRKFETLLKFITKYFNVTTFSEVKKNLFKKPNLILSFDDGYYDFLENVVPLLKKYNISANQNIIINSVKSGLPSWDVQIADMLNALEIDEINKLNLINYKLNKKNQVFYFLSLINYLKKSIKKKDEVLNILQEKTKNKKVKFTKMLSIKDIMFLKGYIEFGCHSYFHNDMKYISLKEFEKDFHNCQNFFDNVGLELNIYAFPYGSYNEEQIQFLKRKKINHILLVNEQYSDLENNIYNRFTFYGNYDNEIKLRALGWHR